jgi:hypothetical protein
MSLLLLGRPLDICAAFGKYAVALIVEICASIDELKLGKEKIGLSEGWPFSFPHRPEGVGKHDRSVLLRPAIGRGGAVLANEFTDEFERLAILTVVCDQRVFESPVRRLFPAFPEDDTERAPLHGVIEMVAQEARDVLEPIGVGREITMVVKETEYIARRL